MKYWKSFKMVNLKYDCLIIFHHAVQRSPHSKEYFYDSYKNKYFHQEKVLDTFNNCKCSELGEKAKPFIIQQYDDNNHCINCKHTQYTILILYVDQRNGNMNQANHQQAEVEHLKFDSKM